MYFLYTTISYVYSFLLLCKRLLTLLTSPYAQATLATLFLIFIHINIKYQTSQISLFIPQPKIHLLIPFLAGKMDTGDHIPISSTPDDHRLKRRHTARYYVHRVQDSLSTRVSKFICTVFLGLLFFVGIIAFIIYLSLRPHRPRFFINELSIPALAQPNGFANAELTYNVTARNSNHKIGIYYDDMQVTAFYNDQKIGGQPVIFPFYQEPKNSTVIFGTLGTTLTVTNGRWMQFLADRTRGKVIFRFEITSTIRFKVSMWDSKWHKMHANCEAGVGADGLMMASYKERRCPTYFT